MTAMPHALDLRNEQAVPLSHIATRNVVSLPAGESLGTAARIMTERRISSMLIVDAGVHPIGIVTERNIVHAMQAGNPPDTPIRAVMSAPIICVPEKVACQEAYMLCLREGIRHLALVDDDGRLTGVASETDFRMHMNLTALTGRRLVTSVMTRSVLSLPPGASLHAAVELMEDHRDSCVVVVERNRPVGIVTERDVVRLYVCETGTATPCLGDVMAAPVHAVSVDTTVNEAANRMLEARVRHLVVVDHAGGLAGLISEHDLTQTMALGIMDAKMDAERAFLRGLVDTIPDLVWLKDPNGIYLACNPPFERVFGVRESAIVGKTDYDFVDRELADAFRDNDIKAMDKDGPNVNEEWITFADDGHRALMETVKTPMRDSAGRLIGVLSIGRDITAARQAQEALKDSEEKLRTLFDAMPDSVQFKDAEGRWLAYNQTAARALGLEQVDCHGKSDRELAELAGPSHRETLLRCRETDLAAAAADDITRIEEEIHLANGDSLSFDVTKVPLSRSDGTNKGLVILARDVTDSRNTTRALRQSLEDFNDLVSRIPVGVFKFRTQADGGRRFDYVSPRWCEMVGMTAEEAYRDVEATFLRTHPEDLEDFLRTIETAIASRAPFDWEGRLRNHRGDRWLHIAASPVPLENGDMQWDGIQYDITERKHSEQRLTMVNFALNHIDDAAYMADPEGRLNYVNDEACRVLGYDRDDLLGKRVWEVDASTGEEDWYAEWERIKRCGTLTLENQHVARDGRVFPVEVRATYFEYLGRPYILGLVRDITERTRAEANLRLAASVFTNTHEGIVITDAAARIVEVNEAFTHITGYARAETLGRNPSLLKSGHQGQDFYQTMWRTIAESGHWCGEVWNRRVNGSVYAEHLTISAVRDGHGSVTHYVGVFADITPFKEHEQRLERIAHYDALTGVPNRVLLADRMAQATAQTLRAGNLMAVCYLDLDGFKPVNDTFGHEAGDRVLVEMARRMKDCLRGGDTIARIGGDEFVLLLLGMSRMEECETALARILEAIARPLTLHDQRVALSASLGVTLFPEDDADADTLLRHADQAMYQAKESGKNRYRLFDPEHDRQIKAHREEQLRLGAALEQEEYVLYFQPKVNMSTGEVLGAEALIRWRHPERGLLLPAEFLPAIKGSDLEVALGEWVIDTTLAQIAVWRRAGHELVVSVNIGADHLLQPDFAERLRYLLEKHPEVAAASLELEILESTAIADTEQASRTLAACRRLGVQFALDDFGTGYSSLTYFRQLPVETLKIDQSFVRNMLDDPEDLGIVESVIQLAQAFNRSVIAEGVETWEHCAALSRLRCHIGQGFGIARPMPAERLPDWIVHWREQRKWQDLAEMPSPKKREDMVLATAVECHLKWVDGVVDFIRAPDNAAEPALHSHQCRFGIWYHGNGALRYGRLTEFGDLDPLHEGIHAMAAELVGLVGQGRRIEALARQAELRVLRDAFLVGLERLIEADRTLS